MVDSFEGSRSPCDRLKQLIEIEGLAQKTRVGLDLDHMVIATHEKDRCAIAATPHLLHERSTIDRRHTHIRDDKRNRRTQEPVEGLNAIARGSYRKPLFDQKRPQDGDHNGVVIDDQNCRHCATPPHVHLLDIRLPPD